MFLPLEDLPEVVLLLLELESGADIVELVVLQDELLVGAGKNGQLFDGLKNQLGFDCFGGDFNRVDELFYSVVLALVEYAGVELLVSQSAHQLGF